MGCLRTGTGLLALLGALMLVGCTAGGSAITGQRASAAIDGRLELPAGLHPGSGARAHVTLRADDGEVLAEQVISVSGGAPIQFRIAYDPAALDQTAPHFLEAQIVLADGSPAWRSEEREPILGGRPGDNLGLPMIPAARGEHGESWRIDCDGYVAVVTYEGGQAHLILSDRELALHPVRAASGARYGSEDISLWSKGREAWLELGGTRYGDCGMQPLSR